MSQTEYCGNCGEEIDPKDQFCGHCGSGIERVDATPDPTPVSEGPEPQLEAQFQPQPQTESRESPSNAMKAGLARHNTGVGLFPRSNGGGVFGWIAVYLVILVSISIGCSNYLYHLWGAFGMDVYRFTLPMAILISATSSAVIALVISLAISLVRSVPFAVSPLMAMFGAGLAAYLELKTYYGTLDGFTADLLNLRSANMFATATDLILFSAIVTILIALVMKFWRRFRPQVAPSI